MDLLPEKAFCFRYFLPLIILVAFALCNTCSPKLVETLISSDSDLHKNGRLLSASSVSDPCEIPLNYLPDSSIFDIIPERLIRMNFHILNSLDSSQNYNPKEAEEFVRKLVENANSRLMENAKMNLPPGNKTKIYSAGYQYKIVGSANGNHDDGIYFHYDDELYYYINKGKNRNNYSRKLIEKYAIGLDTTVNVFVMPHHPDSIASEYYKANASGIALGNGIKLAIRYDTREGFWRYGGLLNHEVGHLLGLRHSWNENDGCNDTPRNPNCWNYSDEPPCNIQVSNNMMDYNVSQSAITPCQLGTVHRNMSRWNSRQRRIQINQNISRSSDIDNLFEIHTDVVWRRRMDLTKGIIVKPGATLRILCEFSMPANSEIILEPGARLILNSKRISMAPQDSWKGIRVLSQGDKKAIVEYTAQSQIRS